MKTNHVRRISDLLKEIYTDETWAVRQYKEGKLSPLEACLYENELNRYKSMQNSIKDIVFKDNPFLKRIKDEPTSFSGVSIASIPKK